MTKPYTVVCVPDPTGERPTDIEENTYVADVIAENISKAMAAGQKPRRMDTSRLIGRLCSCARGT